MLIEPNNSTPKKAITFRVDEQLLKQFKELCKRHNVKQVSVIENALKKAVQELKDLENEK